MHNKPPVKRAFQVRPASEGSFLAQPATVSYLDRHLDRIISILAKRTLADRNRPR